MSTNSYLITSGAGFIGSAVVRRAVRQGIRVLNVDKLTYAASLDSVRSVESSVLYSFAQVDICDRSSIRQLLEDFRPTAVIHLAAAAGRAGHPPGRVAATASRRFFQAAQPASLPRARQMSDAAAPYDHCKDAFP